MKHVKRFCPQCGRRNKFTFDSGVFDTDTGEQTGITWAVECPRFSYFGQDFNGERHTHEHVTLPLEVKR